MKPERWRLFVAVPISDELRRDLVVAVEEWKKRPDLVGLRWTDPSSWHVTLAFLGWVAPDRISTLRSRLGDVAVRHGPMTLGAAGLGAFPSRGRARVAWYGITDTGQRLDALATDLRASLGIDDPRPLRAHLTLARTTGDPVDLRVWLADASAPDGELRVDCMQLMSSHLGRGVPSYDTLESVPLTGPSVPQPCEGDESVNEPPARDVV